MKINCSKRIKLMLKKDEPFGLHNISMKMSGVFCDDEFYMCANIIKKFRFQS